MNKVTQLAISDSATIHLVLQGKGGVGKSFVAAILAQYLQSKSMPVQCLDIDPVNATLAQYKALKAEHVKILKRGTVHTKQFDTVIDRVCENSGVFVIDSGAATFVPLWSYLLENEAFAFLRSRSRRVFLHCVIAGGQAKSDTCNGFHRMAETTEEQNIVVWLNEYFGPIVADGKPFEEFEVATQHAGKLLGTVLIPERNSDTYGEDLRRMLGQRLTFDEAIRSADFTLLAKQRLVIVRRELFEQLDRVAIA